MTLEDWPMIHTLIIYKHFGAAASLDLIYNDEMHWTSWFFSTSTVSSKRNLALHRPSGENVCEPKQLWHLHPWKLTARTFKMSRNWIWKSSNAAIFLGFKIKVFQGFSSQSQKQTSPDSSSKMWQRSGAMLARTWLAHPWFSHETRWVGTETAGDIQQHPSTQGLCKQVVLGMSSISKNIDPKKNTINICASLFPTFAVSSEQGSLHSLRWYREWRESTSHVFTCNFSSPRFIHQMLDPSQFERSIVTTLP